MSLAILSKDSWILLSSIIFKMVQISFIYPVCGSKAFRVIGIADVST